VSRVAALLEEDFDERRQELDTRTWDPIALEKWVLMLHAAVRPEDDIHRSGEGVYSPGQRDQAQGFRSRCITRLARDPSREAYMALQHIRAAPEMRAYLEFVDASIETQFAAAAEQLATPWSEEDILSVERGDEVAPRTNADLFSLVLRHLGRVAALI